MIPTYGKDLQGNPCPLPIFLTLLKIHEMFFAK
jgi:hypothetical protein